ncbi:MAG: S8 family serine peptidase [Flavobacteriales bacterium]
MKTLRIFLTPLLLLCTFSLTAQEKESLDPYLSSLLQRSDADRELNLFLKGEKDAIARFCRLHEGHFKFSSEGYVSIRIEAGKVRTLQQKDFVERIVVQMGKGRALNDTMRVRNRISGIHKGKGLPRSYQGKDVILGYIDSGIELEHPDFQDSTGRTRVLTLWDQTFSDSTNTPSEYGYGQEWDSTDINAGNCPHVDQPGYYGHGTSVASVGSGNGLATGNHAGGAPRSDMIIVSNDLNAANWKATIVDAVDYILERADSIGKPVVINTSLGSYLGPHDAQDPTALMIDSLIQKRKGSMLVSAAGNAGHIPFHLGYSVTSDTNFTWFEYNSSSSLGYGAVYFEAWADTAEFKNVEYAIGADRVNPSYLYRGRTPFHQVQNNLDTTITETLTNGSGDTLAVVETYAQRLEARYKLQVHLKEPDSNQYRFRFITTGSGRFDVWSAGFLGTSPIVDSSSIPTQTQFADIADYKAPDRDKTIVDSWNCSEEVLSVANYVGRVSYTDIDGNIQTVSGTPGAIAYNSSRGPTRNGRNKPDIAATGKVLMTAGPLDRLDHLINNEPHKVHKDSMHMRNGGTSIAAPVMTSIGGLYFQHCPDASHREVIQAVQSTARKDSFTGSLPNDRWGYGKVDAHQALSSSLYDPQLVYTDTVSCGDPIPLSTKDLYESYRWVDSSSANPLMVDSSGTYYAEVFDSSGCPAFTDSVDLTVHSLPPEPIVYQQGDSLFTSLSGYNYQWYRDGSPIPNAVQQGYRIEQQGGFHLVVEDSNSCKNRSDTLYAIPSSINSRGALQVGVAPNPVEKELQVKLSRPARDPIPYELHGLRGETLRSGELEVGQDEERIRMENLAPGVYVFHWKQREKKGSIKLVKR